MKLFSQRKISRELIAFQALSISCRVSAKVGGFTLVETVIAVLAGAVMLVALYASFTLGYGVMRVTREDTRATQILLQKMEAIRLSPYDTVADPSSFPTNATAYYDGK